MTFTPSLVRRRPATLASGMPVSVCNSTTSEASPGPSCTAAAPSASEVWRGWRPCTRRQHFEQRPTSMSKRLTDGAHGAHRGDFFLILRGHAGHVDAPPQSGHAVGAGALWVSSTCAGGRRHPCRPYCAPARRPGRPSPPGAGPWRRGGLPPPRAAGVVELLLEVFATPLQVFAAPLPPVSVAGCARQVLVQLGDLPLEFLNALPRIRRSPGRFEPPRLPFSRATPFVSAGARQFCTTLREFSRLPR